MNKKFIGLIVVAIVAISILGMNTYFNKKGILKNGINSKAIIEKIESNKYDNDMVPSVDNIHITYRYLVDGKQYIKIQEIYRHEHDLYFSKTGKVGDSITIIYDTKNPKNSKIAKIE